MKKVIGFLLILLTLSVVSASVYLQRYINQYGAAIIYIQNDTPNQLYCWVTYNNGYGYFDFYIAPYSQSRHYPEPRGYYEWRCQ